MAEVRDLGPIESVDKIHEMVRHNSTCLFCTELKTDRPFMTRPMTVEAVDNDGNLWFLSDMRSDKNMQISQDEYVQLLFNSDGRSNFMSLFGRAEITRDEQQIGQLWEPVAKAWFKEGKHDPNISVIKVIPFEGYYWDNQHGKLVAFLKILTSLTTGSRMDDQVQGRINP